MLCISSNTVKGNFEEKLKLISESNFNFVEICSFDILQFQNKTEFDVFQASPRTGRLRVSYLGKTVTVSGQVVLVSSQDIY